MPKQHKRSSHRKMILFLTATSMATLPVTAQNYSLTDKGYTAQRKPRVAVMEFEDTNTQATSQRYGRSVSAMLITFLKTKSQFVVVERQNINLVLDEWKNNQNGLTNLVLDETQSEILEKLDVILMGSATLINNGIEVDAKLLSRADGRIITAAERSGPITCLRQIVDRVGVAIEQSFLKPYYGSLRISLDAPENVRAYLSPILSDKALDEEKPPLELGFTIRPGEEQDVMRRWVTHPTSYVIDNILSGWYTLRLERPGYEGQEIHNALFEARECRDESCVRNLLEKRAVRASEAMAAWQPGRAHFQKFLVHVAPLRPNEIDATGRNLVLRKKSGKARFTVLDENARPISGARVSLVSRDLELNPESPDPVEQGEAQEADTGASMIPDEDDGLEASTSEKDGNGIVEKRAPESSGEKSEELAGEGRKNTCTFLIDEEAPLIDHGRRLVRANDTFDLDSFEGGQLAFEDYRGELIPAGTYEAFIWAPYHRIQSVDFRIDDTIEPQNVTVRLARKEQPLILRGRSENMVSFTGKSTGYERRVPLDVASGEKAIHLPVDQYRVDTNVIGFRSWLQGLDLLPPNEAPPSLEELLPTDAADQLAEEQAIEARELRIKNRVWVAGRFVDFKRHPGVYYDHRTTELLDRILGDPASYEWNFELEDDESDHLLELEERLRDVDLLILNEADMSFIRVLPEVEAVVRRFVEGGRALMAFVTWEGNYESVVGAPLAVKRRTSVSSKLKLRPGEVDSFETYFKVDLGSVRPLPKPRHRQNRSAGWRILSYTKKGRKPRVIERGSLDRGGYVMVWFESSELRTDPRDYASSGIWSFFGKIGDFFGPGTSKEVRLEEPDTTLQPAPDEELSKSARKKRERALWVSLQALVKAREANQDILMVKSILKSRALMWAEYLMYREFDTEEENLVDARRRLVSAGAR